MDNLARNLDSSKGSGEVKISAPKRSDPAGFWRRAAAATIDSCVMSMMTMPINIGTKYFSGVNPKNMSIFTTTSLLEMGVYVIVAYFYFGYFYSHFGASPGKMALGLKVMNVKTGKNLTYGQTAKREFFGKFLSYIIFGIGFLMAGLRSDKKALHDIICDTRVFRKSTTA